MKISPGPSTGFSQFFFSINNFTLWRLCELSPLGRTKRITKMFHFRATNCNTYSRALHVKEMVSFSSTHFVRQLNKYQRKCAWEIGHCHHHQRLRPSVCALRVDDIEREEKKIFFSDTESVKPCAMKGDANLSSRGLVYVCIKNCVSFSLMLELAFFL